MKELMSIIIMLIFINPVFSCTSKKKKKEKKNRKKIDETFVDANLLYLSEAHLRWSIL